jgi:hypothetical protein
MRASIWQGVNPLVCVYTSPRGRRYGVPAVRQSGHGHGVMVVVRSQEPPWLCLFSLGGAATARSPAYVCLLSLRSRMVLIRVHLRRTGMLEVTQPVSNLPSLYTPELAVCYTAARYSDHQGFLTPRIFEHAGPVRPLSCSPIFSESSFLCGPNLYTKYDRRLYMKRYVIRCFHILLRISILRRF